MQKLYFVFTADGQMSLKDVLQECKKDRWTPINYIKYNNGKIAIPCFKNEKIAKKFAKRNFPRGIFGCIGMFEKEIKKLVNNYVDKRGWHLEIMNYPKLIKDIGEFDIIIHEFDNSIEVYRMS